jgi:pimeloyl-ACP methyl ester carboxylesterase
VDFPVDPADAMRASALRKPVVLAAALMLLAGGVGCSSMIAPEPDLERLYAAHAGGRRTPVIVIPGVFGSRLREPDSGVEIWPGSLFDLLTGRRLGLLALSPTGRLAAAVGDRLQPGDVFFEAFGRDYYGTILATLTGPGGYRCIPSSALADAAARADCVLLPWDWRRDLVEAAAELDRVIRRLRALRGDPELRVDLVAHSAGGLVARYYLRFGARDVLDRDDPEQAVTSAGESAVRRAILIGTPNYGSVSALQGAIMGNSVGVAMMRPELLATMPSLFELFPNPNRTWMIDVHGSRLDVDLFDVETWRRYRWSIFDPEVRERIAAEASGPAQGAAMLRDRERFFAAALTRARRFHQALSAPLGEVATEYVVFGGDCELTPARCLLEEVGGRVVIRLHPEEVRNRVPGVDYEALMLEPGDGRVTKASLLARDSLAPDAARPGFFPIAYAVFICRGHAELPSDVTFRDNLLNILLY